MPTYAVKLLVAFLALAGFATAQQIDTTMLSGTTVSDGGVVTLDLPSSDIQLRIPLRTKAGGFTFSLVGAFHVFVGAGERGSQWQTSTGHNLDGGSLSPSAGIELMVSAAKQSTTTCDGLSNDNLYSELGINDPNGQWHPLPSSESYDSMGCYKLSATSLTTDGSGYTLVANSSGGPGYVYDKGGYDFTSYQGSIFNYERKDPDGNTVYDSCSGTGSGFECAYTDTLGSSAIEAAYDQGPNQTTGESYTYADSSKTTQSYTVTYSTFNRQSAFGCGSVVDRELPTGIVYLPTNISTPTGASYTISYEQTPGAGSTYTTTRVAKVTFPYGGYVSYSYSDTTGNNGINCISGVVPTITRTVNDNNGNTRVWTYVNSLNSKAPSNFTVTETDPAGNQTVYNFSGPAVDYQFETYDTNPDFITQVNLYQGSANGLPLKTVLTCYNSNTSNCAAPATAVSLPITETDVRTALGTSLANRVTTTFDSYANPLVISAYDFGGTITAPSGALLSTTTNVYGQSYSSPTACTAYPSGMYIYNTPCYSYAVNSAGTTVAQTKTAYSNTGHPTSVQKWTSGSNWLTSSATYNSNGTLATATDPNNSKTTFTNYLCNGMLPSTMTLPQIPGESFQMSSSATWDCNGGVLLSQTDLNTPANTTTYSYNDPLWRQTQVSYPDGGGTTTTYNSPTSISTSTIINNTTNLNKTTFLDGLGRVIQSQLTSDPGGTDYVDTTYNSVGEVYTVSNPYRQGDTTALTIYSYDALGRMTQLTHPDNSYISAVYTGRATQVTDEGNGGFNVQRISQVDGLGRLTSVCEVTQTNPGGGSSCGQDIGGTGFLTSYTYDALGNLLTVAQGSLNGRIYQYDGLSRLTSASDPESGTIYYGYNGSGDLYQRISPTSNDTGTIGTVTTYTRDLLHRLTNVTYSHSDGSTASLPVAFYYDEPNPWGVTATNYKGRLSQTAAQNFTVGSVYSYDPMGRISNEWQCTPMDCGTTATYFTYGYDKLGNLTSSNNNSDGITYTYGPYNGADELTQMQSSLNDSQHPGTLVQFKTYSAFGKPEQIVYGNGVTTSLGYDTRMRLYFSNQGTPYDYNIMKSSSPFVTGYAPDNDILYGNDSVNGDWTYTYDALNRLVTASCNTTYSCPPTSGVTYTYDRYGNRLTESVKSGSGTAPDYFYNANNQIDVSGVTYDEAGNVIASGTGIGDPFTYDDENRVTGAGYYSASYVYDAFGNRVRSTVNGQTNDFLYDLNGKTIDQFANGTLSRSEAYAGGMHIATYENGTTYFDSSDWLSTFRVRTDVSGTNVESCTSMPFGEDLTCTLPLTSEVSPLHFTGQEHDWESGNDHFAFRYYNEVMGRWLSPDPAGLGSANPANPQSWNRYAYVMNNPLSMVDPLGLCGRGGDDSDAFGCDGEDPGDDNGDRSDSGVHDKQNLPDAPSATPTGQNNLLQMLPLELARNPAITLMYFGTPPDLGSYTGALVGYGMGQVFGWSALGTGLRNGQEVGSRGTIGSGGNSWDWCAALCGSVLGGLSNFSAGAGDFLSFGLTTRFNAWTGAQSFVDTNSIAYAAGIASGVGVTVAGGALTAGKAFAGLDTKIAVHSAHHLFPLIGEVPHLQIMWWLAGVAGSGQAIRIPLTPWWP